MTGKIKGFLNFKQYSAFGDSWPSCLCEFDPSSKHLTVSLKKGGAVLLSTQVQDAKPVPPKFNRRPNRFDVVTEADGVAAFTAPSDVELTQWLQAFAGTLLASPASTHGNASCRPLPQAVTAAAEATASRNSSNSLDITPPASPIPPSASSAAVASDDSSPDAMPTAVEASSVSSTATVDSTASPVAVVEGSVQEAASTSSPSPASANATATPINSSIESKTALYERVADAFAAHKLGHFLLAIHDCDASPTTLQAFHELDDEVLLGPQVGMKKMHVVKYRRAVSSLKSESS